MEGFWISFERKGKQYGRYGEELKQAIETELRKWDDGIRASDLANILGVSYNTVRSYLLEMIVENRIEKYEYGKNLFKQPIELWRIKKNG